MSAMNGFGDWSPADADNHDNGGCLLSMGFLALVLCAVVYCLGIVGWVL